MAAKKTNTKRVNAKRSSDGKSKAKSGGMSIERKKRILGGFLIFVAALLFLAGVSYSRADEGFLKYEFADLFRQFGDRAAQGDSPSNWLGVFGAYYADFSINSTLGYFSLVFPVILALWGKYLVRKTDFRELINLSNFILLMAIALATLFGVLRAEFIALKDAYELSGYIGAFFGSALVMLIGSLGSALLLVVGIVALIVAQFDLKLEPVFARARAAFGASAEKLKAKAEERKEAAAAKREERLKREAEEQKRQTKITKKPAENKSKPTPAPESAETEKPTEEAKSGKRKPPPDPDVLFEEEIVGEETTVITIGRKRKAPEPSDAKDASDAKAEAGEPSEEAPAPKPAPKKAPANDAPPRKETAERARDARLEAGPANVDREREAALPEPWEEEINFRPPALDLLDDPPEADDEEFDEEELERNAQLLREKLARFDIEIEDVTVTPGPVVTLYEIVPAPGVKISKIVGLEDDIALALAAKGIRIIAPIPGKGAIGVEIPNAEASMVTASMILPELRFTKALLPLALGKTISGESALADLASMPHLLVAGATGSGKSVGINMMIASLLYSKAPNEVKLAIVDPKKVELSFYNKLRRHYLAVSPDLDEDIVTVPRNAVLLLKSITLEMDKRYDMLADASVRNIREYNDKLRKSDARFGGKEGVTHHFMPFIVVIIDELADLMITAGKEVEEPIARLAQLARAVGIHLVVATQRPSVNVITGVIKANFSARMAYQVASKIDSRTILDLNGAERLLGKGDMLFIPGGAPKPERVQNAFISTEEVERITDFVERQPGYSKPYFLPSVQEKKDDVGEGTFDDMDDRFRDAARVVVRNQQGSVSLLQRRLKLGYARAARIVDQLEDAGVVGPAEGGKAREVLIENEERLETLLRQL
jgi:S-DNA-T family DNA segregation ATPase FtsK/SpoIIIE